MSFIQNPFQKRYLPVLVALVLGVAACAITHQVSNLVVMGVLALFQWANADQPLAKPFFYGYVGLAAFLVSLTVYSVFVGVLGAAAVSGALSLLPLSIIFTRKHQ